MENVIKNIDWMQVISVVWTAVLLPVITYVGTQISNYAKSKRIDTYTDILYKNVVSSVKDVYETIVKDMKGSDDWTEEKKYEVKEIAKTKAIQALSNSAYEILKAANGDFNEYLDGLIGTALYDLKTKANIRWFYEMDGNYTNLAVHIQEVDSRSRSNEHRLDDHDTALRELREKQDAIYDLTSSVKSIATDMAYIKEDVKEVKSGQDKLNEKVTFLENRPANEAKKKVDGLTEKILWLVIGGVVVGLLSAILPNIPW